MIRHVVSWKLAATDAEGKSRAFAEVAEALGTLPSLIPDIKSMQVGRDVDDTEGNWDAVLIVDFATTAGLAGYQVHPEHVKVKAIIGSRTVDRATVDFEL